MAFPWQRAENLMRNARSSKNDNTRAMLENLLKSMQLGDTFSSTQVAEQLSKPKRCVAARTMGSLLRERDDVKLVDKERCIWKKVK
jgi:hypothetical protein